MTVPAVVEIARLKGGLEIVLDAYGYFLQRYVSFDDANADRSSVKLDAAVLWLAHTFIVPWLETSPRLAITSPVKGSGKSRLLDCLALLACSPVRWVQPSDAVVYRVRAVPEVTILLDEIDTLFGPTGRSRAELRAILNEGYRRGASVPRVGAFGAVEQFPIFGPVAFAGLSGALHETLASRCIELELWKAADPDRLLGLDLPRHADDAERDAAVLHAMMRARLHERGALVSLIEPELPQGLRNREAELWLPLLMIADYAGGTWPQRARAAASVLANRRDEDAALATLRIILELFVAATADRLSTASILAGLSEHDHAQRFSLPSTPRALAQVLQPFHIAPRNVRFPDRTQAKGYERRDFQPAWRAYLGTDSDA
jgi:hypothetical protein